MPAELYFRADDGTSGTELWKLKSDGTAVRVSDINPGSGSSSPLGITLFKDELYFQANGGASGVELWKVKADGTVVQVADINPTGSSNPFGFRAMAGELYFVANDGTFGSEIWKVKADGTVARVSDVNPGGSSALPFIFTEFNGELFFSADDGSAGFELWKVKADGTVVQAMDFNSGPGSSLPSFPAVFGGELYGSANAGTSNGIWKIKPDGSIVSLPGASTGGFISTIFNGTLYFQAGDAAFGNELWKVQGNSIVRVTDIAGGPVSASPSEFVTFNGELYFRSTSVGGPTNVELWKVSAGGAASQVTDINPGAGSSFPIFMTPFNGDLYFQADDGTSGAELWKVNSGGTVVRVADINPGPGGSSPFGLTVFNGELHFRANDGSSGAELWKLKTDGTVVRVHDINGGAGSSNPFGFFVSGLELFTAADDGVNFNSLSADQKAAIAAGSALYSALAGNDQVTLPNIANANQVIAGATTLGWNYGTTFDAGPGNDTITGGDGSDKIDGGADDDVLSGGGGSDSIAGGAGIDTIDGGSGSDSLSGGPGDDTFVVDAAGDAVQENPGGGTDLVRSSVTYTLGPDVENLTLTGTAAINGTGNGGANVITGNSGGNVLTGNTGSDTFLGLGGNDTILITTPSANVVENQTAEGGTGADYIEVVTSVNPSLNVTIDGGLENDTIRLGSYFISAGASAGTYHVFGGDGDDVINGRTGGGTYFLDGGNGNDTISGYYNGLFHMTGGAGNDVFNGTTYGINNMAGGDGDDVLTASVNGVSVMAGDAGNDTFYAGDGGWGSGSTTISGGIGNDTIYRVGLGTYGGAYSVDAGDGVDTVHILNSGYTASNTATVTLGAGADLVVADVNPYFGSSYIGLRIITITDFQTGVGGDKFDFTVWLNALTGYSAGTNPFTTGFMQLVQSGADVLLQVDQDGAAAARGYVTNIRFNNTTVAAFTPDNLFATNTAPGATGNVVDGYVAGATVFWDANGDATLNPGEFSTITDANGNFPLTGGTGSLIAFGGTDVLTGLPLRGQLTAPNGATVITPLTTLIGGLQMLGLTLQQAQQTIAAGLGLDANLDLTTLDPVAATRAGDAPAAAAFVAGVKVMGTVTATGYAIAGVGGDADTAQRDAFLALAGLLGNLSPGQTLDLSDAATIAGLLSDVAQSQHVDIGPSVGSAASVIAANNATLDQTLQTNPSGQTLLNAVSAAQLDAHGPYVPTANADSATTDEDHSTVIMVLANDTAADAGDDLRIVSAAITDGALGSITVAADGRSIIYDPAGAYDSLAAGQHATVNIGYFASDSAGGTASAIATVAVAGLDDAPNDFNGDGHSDMLWQNLNGTPGIWTMDGLVRIEGANVGFNPGPAWHVKAAGDFNADNHADILWQNDNGTAGIWLMDGFNIVADGVVGFNPGASWKVIDAADFNADGRADILWQNDNGTAGIWTMDGLTRTGGANVGFNPGPSWHVKAAGDFNADGHADILWQNDDGSAGVWLMDGFNRIDGANVGFNPGPSWKVIDAGDFNGDGKADILWQNENGTPGIWTMDGLTRTGGANVGGINPGPSWKVKSAGDYNGDGRSDILWQNDNGQPGIWLMDGFNVLSDGAVGFNPGLPWHVVGQPDLI